MPRRINKALADKDGEFIRPSWLAQEMGLRDEEFEALEGFPEPNDKGDLPFGAAIEAALKVMRGWRQLVEGQFLADILQVTVQRIYQMANEGIVHQISRGRFDLVKSLTGIIIWQRETRVDDRMSATSMKKKGLELDNQLKQLALSRAMRDAYDRQETETAWSERLHAAAELLRQTPAKIAPRIAYMRDEAEATAEFTKLIDEVCAELARPVDYEAKTEPES